MTATPISLRSVVFDAHGADAGGLTLLLPVGPDRPEVPGQLSRSPWSAPVTGRKPERWEPRAASWGRSVGSRERQLDGFFDLILRNLWRKPARSLGLILAVAIAVMTVVTLDVTSSGLEQSAAAIISIGKADFTVVQKGASTP